MVRMGVTEAEILGEVEKRRLLTGDRRPGRNHLAPRAMSSTHWVTQIRQLCPERARRRALRARRIGDQRTAAERPASLSDAQGLRGTSSNSWPVLVRAFSSRFRCALCSPENSSKLRGDQIVLSMTRTQAHPAFPRLQFRPLVRTVSRNSPQARRVYQRMKPHIRNEVLFVSSDRDEIQHGQLHAPGARCPGPPSATMRRGRLKAPLCGDPYHG